MLIYIILTNVVMDIVRINRWLLIQILCLPLTISLLEFVFKYHSSKKGHVHGISDTYKLIDK